MQVVANAATAQATARDLFSAMLASNPDATVGQQSSSYAADLNRARQAINSADAAGAFYHTLEVHYTVASSCCGFNGKLHTQTHVHWYIGDSLQAMRC